MFIPVYQLVLLVVVVLFFHFSAIRDVEKKATLKLEKLNNKIELMDLVIEDFNDSVKADINSVISDLGCMTCAEDLKEVKSSLYPYASGKVLRDSFTCAKGTFKKLGKAYY